jgi:hypothetical protein
LAAIFKKTLRETIKPLISLKTAKFGASWAQRYQGLSRTHDFAGETNSFRPGFVGGSIIWKKPLPRRKVFSPRNPLKTLNCDKEIFGKAWQKMPFLWKNLAKRLGKVSAPAKPRVLGLG